MKLELHKLATKFHIALVGVAVLSIMALSLAFRPILQSSIRDDRVKLFVEQSTRALAETVSHHLVQYQERVRTLAAKLATQGGSQAAELRLINLIVRERVTPLLAHGIFDLIVVVQGNGSIQYANTLDSFGNTFDTSPLWGRHIGEFREEEKAFLGALSGSGKHDWYPSPMVKLLSNAAWPDVADANQNDAARNYAIAFAERIPGTDRVLLAVVNWEAVQAVLDSSSAPLARVGFPSGYAFMFAHDANTIIAHKQRNLRGTNNYSVRLVETLHLPDLSQAVKDGQLSFRYEYPPGTPKISGLSRVDDPDFGWTVGLGINDADVVAPVQSLTRRLALVGVAVILLALLLSRYLSHRITLDLRELTRSVLRIGAGGGAQPAAVRSRDEVGQLATAFNAMAAGLVERDDLIRRQQERLFERMRVDQELRIAAEVQRRLLPQIRPPVATLDYFGVCQPAGGVSGDTYDFLALAPDRLGLLVADISGKGISASLIMASLHACVRTHAPLLGERCGELVATLNSLLYESTDADRFATIFYAVYEQTSRRLTYVNAGHWPPLVVRAAPHSRAVPVSAAGSLAGAHHAAAVAAPALDVESVRALTSGLDCQLLSSETTPLGLFETVPDVQRSVELYPGDWLVIFSDGLPEALNAREEEFGLRRIVEAVQAHSQATAEEMSVALRAAVASHIGARAPSDDLTLITARVL